MALERSSYYSRAVRKPIVAAEVPRLTKKALSSPALPAAHHRKTNSKLFIARRDTRRDNEGRAL
jgi:hypothetical protein